MLEKISMIVLSILAIPMFAAIIFMFIVDARFDRWMKENWRLKKDDKPKE